MQVNDFYIVPLFLSLVFSMFHLTLQVSCFINSFPQTSGTKHIVYMNC